MTLTNQILIDEWCPALEELATAVLTTIRTKIAPKLVVAKTGEEGLALLICHIGQVYLVASKASGAGAVGSVTSLSVGDTSISFGALHQVDTSTTGYYRWVQTTPEGNLYYMCLRTGCAESFLPIPLC